MIIEEPRKMANRASLIIAIRCMHPSQTQKARRYLSVCTSRPNPFSPYLQCICKVGHCP
jgi:hypothetical protein